ncbi:hypothetical protein AKO1_002253, partial [Acrasis kona]
MKGLCDADSIHLNKFQSSSDSRACIDRILEVVFFNMMRPHDCLLNMWSIFGNHLVNLLYKSKSNQEFIIDTIRHLLNTFIDHIPDSSDRILYPLVDCFKRSGSKCNLRELLINNVMGPIIMRKKNTLKVGWKSILDSISTCVKFANTTDVISEYLFDEYISPTIINANTCKDMFQFGCFSNLVKCLSSFANRQSQGPISNIAVEYIVMCAQNIAMNRIQGLTHDRGDEWKLICDAMCEIACDAMDHHIRHFALDSMNNILRQHCVGKQSPEWWDDLFGNCIFPIMSNVIERECDNNIIMVSESSTKITDDVHRCAALLTEWVGVTMPHMCSVVVNLASDTLVDHEGYVLLVNMIGDMFAHSSSDNCNGQLGRRVIFNHKLAEMGRDLIVNLMKRDDMTQDKWCTLRDRIRDLILVDTNAPSHISNQRFNVDVDVFDVEYKVHICLIHLVDLMVTNFCCIEKTLKIKMDLNDVKMFLEIVWSSYSNAHELHQDLLSAQLRETRRVSKRYNRMVHLRPRLIRHESATLTVYLKMLFSMLTCSDELAVKTSIKILLPLSRDLIDAYLNGIGEKISLPDQLGVQAVQNIDNRLKIDLNLLEKVNHDGGEDDDDDVVVRLDTKIGTISRDLIRVLSPQDEDEESIPSPRVHSPHRRSVTQLETFERPTDDTSQRVKTSQKRRRSIQLENVRSSSQSNAAFLMEHMEQDVKMNKEMVGIVSLL